MIKTGFKTAGFIITISIMTGCAAHDETFHSALNKDTQAVSDLAREQAKMITSKASAADVFGKVLQADPFLNEIRKLCIKPEKGGDYPSKSCIFYKDDRDTLHRQCPETDRDKLPPEKVLPQ